MTYILADFQQEVKSYSRLSKGKLIRVNQHSRQGNTLTPQEDTDLRRKVQSGLLVGGVAAVAGLSLVGLSLATKGAIVTKHGQNVEAAAAGIKKAAPISDYKKYSRLNPSKLPDLDKYDNIIITTGGFGGDRGELANDLLKSFKDKYPKSFVIAVENKYFDTTIKNLPKRVLATPELLFNSTIKGNQSATDLAEVAYNVRSKTDKPITFVGTSGGGMAVKNAQEITDTLGVRNIQGIGLGSPTFALSKPKSPYISLFSGNDFLVKTPGINKSDIVKVGKTFDINKARGLSLNQKFFIKTEEHQGVNYLTNPEARNVIDRIVNRK